MIPATWICSSQSSISSCRFICKFDPSYLDMRLPAIHQQQHAPYIVLRCVYCMTSATVPGHAPPSYPAAAVCSIHCAALCVLYDLSFLDLRLPAIHQQQHAPDAVLYCVYCMTSATWICASRPATSCCMFSCHSSITPPSTQREGVANFYSIIQVNLKQTLLLNVAFHQLKYLILSFSKTVNSYKL